MGIVPFLFAITLSVVMQSRGAAAETRFRRPIAVTLSTNTNRLFAANRDSGTVSVLDTTSLTVTDELTVGGRLTDIVSLPHGQLLALDAQNHQLILFKHNGNRWQIESRTKVARCPVRVVLDRNSNCCFVSSLWSRAISKFKLSPENDATDPQHVQTVRLPFEPRELCLTDRGDGLIVASAFGASLAVIEPDNLSLRSLKSIPGHNIGGLAIKTDTKQLLIAQQELNPLAHSTRDDVHWGNMISNLLVSFPLDQVCDPSAELLNHRVANQLGEPGAAAGDPGCIIIGPGGEIAVLLSGVHEVAVTDPEHVDTYHRVSVGKRPISAVSSPDGRLFVANMFSDSVSVLNFSEAEEVGRVSLGPQPEMDLDQRGETLFFDSRLSHDGWMSCHSCHTDGHSNGQLNDNLSDGSFGAPKRVLSLLGVADTGPWAWNGEVKSLEQQVANSIERTMQGESPGEQQVAALVAFLKTLSTPLVIPDDQPIHEASTQRGHDLLVSLRCVQCHAPPTYTSPKSYNVGLSDSVGNNLFNPPSLRGVANRHSFFHDSRATSLTEVFSIHKHQLSEDLAQDDIESLVNFLKTVDRARRW